MREALRVLHRPTARQAIAVALCLFVAFGFNVRVYAVNVTTDGTMETAPTTNWPLTNVTSTNTAARDTTVRNGGAASLRGTSQSGKNRACEWYHSQSVGTIDAGSTVNLSFWYSHQSTNAAAGATSLFVDASPDGTNWTQLWTANVSPTTTRASATVAATNVSASFSTTATYSLRLRVSTTTPNSNGSVVNVWWDDVVLDVVAPPLTTTVGDGADPSSSSLCPGGAATVADSFSLTSNRSASITGVNVTLGTGVATSLASVAITNDTQTVTYGTVNNPGSDSFSIPVTLTSTATPVNYDIVITPKSQATMPAGTFAVAAQVTGVSGGGTVTDNDDASTTLTIDNAAPSNATWGTNTAGDSSVTLNWTNPGSDFAEVVILRNTAAISDAPAEGASYTSGNTIGSSTVVYAGNSNTTADNGVTNGQTYYYKIFSRDACSNYSAGVQSAALAPVAITTTVGNGTNPSNASLCPGDAATMLDAFTLQTSTSTSTVSGVTVSLAAGTSTALSLLEITNDAGSTVYGSVANPSSDTVSVGLSSNITATTTATQYKVRVTPKTAPAMPANGTNYSVTGTVTGITSGGLKTYNDTASATLGIDNTAPADAAWGTNTPGDSYVDLAWTNPGSDFSQVVILRGTAAISDVPVEGTTYAIGNTIGSSTVVYVGSLATFRDNTVTNGTNYYYRIFSRDGCANYAAGTSAGPLQPSVPVGTTTVGDGTNPSNASLCPGDGATMLDAFTLQNATGSVTVNSVTVTLAAGTATALSLVEVTNDAGSTVYGSVANPATDTPSISLSTTITSTTSLTQYKIRVTPKTATGMPGNVASPYSVTGTVTAIGTVQANSKTYSDSASATLTIDNAAPSNATWGTNNAADGYVDLAWTNPGADFTSVVILRGTASIADAPAEGSTYTAGNTVGSTTVVYAGNATSYRDNSVTNGTSYYYKIFARDACGNYSTGLQSGPLAPALVVGTTTVGNGTNPSSVTLCPGAGATMLDAFTLQQSAGSITVNSITVTLSAGSSAALSLIEITNDAGTTVYGSAAPATDTPTIALSTTITSTTTATQYKVRITPKTAVAMPANAASPYTVTGTVSAIATTPSNTRTYSDSASATLTIDNTAPSAPTWGTNVAGDTRVDLAWTNPATDFTGVVILRGTAAITDAPVEGATYTAGNTIGSSTVVYAGNLTSYRDSTVVNDTAYHYRIFARDACGNYSAGVASGPLTPFVFVGDMTVGDGVNPGAASVCPGSGAVMLDAFTLQNAGGASTVTAVGVTLTPGMYAALSKVEITNDDGSVVYGSANNPSSDVVAITLGTTITVNATQVQYKIRVTPRTHAAMPANAASPYSINGTVTSVTSTNNKIYSDTTSGLLVIDNSAPAAAVWGAGEVGDQQVALWWTADADQVVVLRKSAAGATDVPVDGASYTAGQTIGTSAVRYVGSGATFTDTGLTNGTDYYYRIFTRDACGNYSAAVQSSAYRPNINVPKVTPGTATYTTGSCVVATNVQPITVSVPFTGDTPATGSPNSSTKFYLLDGSVNAAGVEKCTSTAVSPRSCTMDLPLSVDGTSKTYYVKVRFSDADGVVGPAEQVVGPLQTPVKCEAAGTAALTATAVRGACNQIDVFVPFTGDGDRDGSAKVEYNTANTWPGTVSCPTLLGQSPRTCKITGLTGATAYYVRVTYTDPDGVTGSATQVLPQVAAKACGADTAAPMGTFLSPARRAVIGGAERVKVQVFDNVSLAASPLVWMVDGTSGTWNSGATKSADYSTAVCGRSDDPRCGIWEFDLPAFATNGEHYISLQLTDTAGNTAIVTQPVQVKGAGAKSLGTGSLLRRTQSSQLCIDCHTYKGHSSQTAGSTKYGNWGLECLTCHTPHGTTNIGLIRNQIETPNSGMKTVEFRTVDKVGDTNPEYGHLGQLSVAGDGLCEACHTKTLHYTNATVGDAHYPGARCTNCHGHSSGFKAEACNDCHDAPPTGPHRRHDEVWDSTPGKVPASYGDTTNHGTATQYGYSCSTCHSGTHKNDATVNPTHSGSAANPWLVEVAFRAGANTTAPFSGSYSAVYKQATDAPQGIYFSTSAGSCGGTYCHSNANPVGGTNAPVAVTWNSTATTCSSCHKMGGSGDTGFDATALSKSHNKHIQSASGETGTYSFKCYECHADVMNATATNPWLITTTDLKNKQLHVNEARDVKFVSVGSANQSAAVYDDGALTCTGSYCHSQGTTTTAPFPAPNTNIVWNGTGSCVTCHNGNAARTGNKMATGKHLSHIDIAATFGYNFTCASCHSATVTADETIGTYANHVNGLREVAGTYVGTWGGTATPTCTNSRCHSSGVRFGTLEYYNTGLNWTTGTAINDCKGCHGRHSDNSFVSLAGEPNYTNFPSSSKYNNHKVHVTSANDCKLCHASTIATSNKIDGPTPAKHMDFDGVPDITFAAAYAGSYDAPSRTCSNNYCHSQGVSTTAPFGGAPNTVAVWGNVAATAADKCIYCHDGNASATNKTNGWMMVTGKHQQHIDIAATYGVDLGCVACHSDTVSADLTISNAAKHTNQLREVNGAWTGTWTSPNCTTSKCHASGEWRTTPEYYSISWTGATTLDCKGCHGRSTSAGFFTSVAGEPNYASNGTTRFNSHQKHVLAATDCSNCHASTVATSSKIDGTDVTKHLDIDNVPDITFKATWGGTYASAGRTCTNNYCHSKGTATYQAPVVAVAWGGTAMTCATCHGGNAGSTSPIATPGHAAHVNNATTMGYNLGCISCHSGTVATDTTFASGVTTLNHIDKSRPVTGTYVGTWNGTTCTTSRCHSNGQRLGTPEYYTATWSTESITTCAGCHGRSTTPAFASVAGEPNYATNAGASRYNSHKAHVSSSTDCKTCHSITVGTADKIDGTTPTKHMDFDGVPEITIAGGSYNKDTRQCATACHGAGTPVWGGAAMVCSDCHVGAADVDNWNITDGTVSVINTTEWTTNGHGNATVALPGTDKCVYCHDKNVGHKVATNPFRLANVATDVNGVCLICHGTGSAGYNPGSGLKNGTKKIDSYHYATKHGASNNGGRRCWDCHDPHGDSNIKMIGKVAIKTSADNWGLSATRTNPVTFTSNATAAGYVTNGTGITATGICNVCHATAGHYTATAGDSHGGAVCTSCHAHDQAAVTDAFKNSGGGGCRGCHGTSTTGTGGKRRAVDADFADGTSPNFRSHHVGNGTTNTLKGTLTDFDCIVCHAEGKITAGATDTTGQPHMDGKIDLRNVDNATAYFTYDVDAIKTSAGTDLTQWSSANAAWRTQTSTALDPFCLSCHDSNGATAIANFGETGATATNPFKDTTIANNYDQLVRPGPVDIKTKVMTGVTMYSRHAIRGTGMAPSVYTKYTGTLTGCSGTATCKPIYDYGFFVQNGTDENGKPNWNDTSVMGCADCHTSDGANGSSGNAHGSLGEYLLKNNTGASTAVSSMTTYVCYRCHLATEYSTGSAHANNGGDYQNYTEVVGSARVPAGNTGGSIFGMACMNCHGGGPSDSSPTRPTAASDGFGWIHGTNQTYYVGYTTTTRNAYRFMNGGSMRYWDPNGWNTSTGTCWTLGGTGRSNDAWGGCTKHSGSASQTRSVFRPLSY